MCLLTLFHCMHVGVFRVFSMGEERSGLRPLPAGVLQLAADGAVRLQQVDGASHPDLVAVVAVL